MAEKQRILIVDDDSSIAELISLYLEKECFSTTIAEDGEEALSLYEKERADLLILDLMLPGIDGYEVCRRIRASSDVPIIMLPCFLPGWKRRSTAFTLATSSLVSKGFKI